MYPAGRAAGKQRSVINLLEAQGEAWMGLQVQAFKATHATV
jgi:hypothetical protein